MSWGECPDVYVPAGDVSVCGVTGVTAECLSMVYVTC